MTKPDLMFVWACVGARRPFLRARLTDDQAVEVLNELLHAERHFREQFDAHLIADEGTWTVVAHPWGIHHFAAADVDDGGPS